jgi:hypothetical protein
MSIDTSTSHKITLDQVIEPAVNIAVKQLGETAVMSNANSEPVSVTAAKTADTGAKANPQLKQAVGGGGWYIGHPSQY